MDMIFEFEHLGLWDAEEKRALDIVALKNVLTKWQKGLEKDGWNALFVENHDKPRIISTWGNDQEYRYESATAIGAVYFLMQGTPFIYQGQEIGMTNVQFPSIDDYDDLSTKNLYHKKLEEGMPHQEIMELIWASSRDNNRTPMQWSDKENAGFTTGQPWIKVNPNYVDINVESASKANTSVLRFYKKMIKLKKENRIFTYGNYDLLLATDKQIYAYTRTTKEEKVIVMGNLSIKEATFSTSPLLLQYEQLLLHNYEVEKHQGQSAFTLKPYETRVYRI